MRGWWTRAVPNRMRITMFNARVTLRHATGEAKRRHLKDEAEFRSVLRDELGLRMTDEELRTCIDVMQRRGDKGAPHPFFARGEVEQAPSDFLAGPGAAAAPPTYPSNRPGRCGFSVGRHAPCGKWAACCGSIGARTSRSAHES